MKAQLVLESRGKKVGDVVTVIPVNSDKEFQYKILDFHK